MVFRIIAILLLLTHSAPNCLAAGRRRMHVQKGVLDLRRVNFTEGSIFRLDGEWEFYWKRFIDPEKKPLTVTPSPDGYAEVPSYWTDLELNGERLPGQGYASYRLLVFLPAGFDDPLAFDVPVFDDSYALFIDGKKMAGNGKPGISTGESQPAYAPKRVICHPSSDTLELVIHVSNFHHRRGGFWKSMRMGTVRKISETTTLYRLISFVSLGVLMSFSLFFLFFFLFFRKRKVFLFFSLALMGVFFRLLSTDMYPLMNLADVSWTWLVRIEYLGSFGALLSGMWYFHSLFPSRFMQRINQVNTIIICIIFLVILFSGVPLFSYTILYFQPVTLAMIGYYLVISFMGSIRGNREKLIYFAGLLVLVLALINDIRISNSQSAMSRDYAIHFAVQFFVFIQAIMLVRAWTLAFKEQEKLRSEIKFMNINLENLVSKRTEELKARNKEISLQHDQIARQNKKLKETLVIRNRLFSIIAHDLKSPVANIVQLSELMDMDISRADLDKVLKSTRELARSAYHLIDNLLYWGRSQGKQIQHNPEKCNVAEMAGEVLVLFRHTADRKSIELELIKQDRLYAYCDRELIRIVLRNLLSNALKFTKTGGRVEVKIYHVGEDNQMVYVAVGDNGIGIPAEKLKKLFHKEDLESTYGTDQEKGTGLGLTLCKDLVDLNRGKLTVESTPGEGTTAIVALPVWKQKGNPS